MSNITNIFIQSFSLVRQVCHKYGVKNSTSNSSVSDLISLATKADKDQLVERVKLSQFFVSRPHKVLGCLINKVASSSIVKTFLKLEGFAVKDVASPHAYGNKLHPHVSLIISSPALFSSQFYLTFEFLNQIIFST